MPLFNLTSIDFGRDTRTGGPADLISDRRGVYEIKKYPLDIGNYDKGHYMIIHINEQRETQFSTAQGPDLPTILKNQRVSGLTPTSASVGVNRNATSIGNFLNFDGSIGSVIGQFERPIRRTKKTIALYMPDTVAFGHNENYSDASATGIATALLAAGKSAVDAFKMPGNFGTNLASNLGAFVGAGSMYALKKIGFGEGFTQALGQSLIGAVQNPLLEVIYSSPVLRQFSFEFMFYPRSEREAREVQQILHMFRYYQAPEILEKSAGFFLVPPSEFDIQFYYNGKINPNIPPISTCVLTGMNVDYAPNGWAAYETGGNTNSLNPTLGATGMPVAIRLTLNFKETEIVTKQFINATEGRPGSVDLSVYSGMTGNLDGGGDTFSGDGTELGR